MPKAVGKYKVCSRCLKKKSVDEFHKNKSNFDKLQYWCKSCIKEMSKNPIKNQKDKKYKQEHYKKNKIKYKNGAAKRQKENPIKHSKHNRKSKLKAKYGLTIEDYDRMFEAQNGVCYICGQLNYDGRRLCVDHSHKTGKVRKLLCYRCNFLVGTVENIDCWNTIVEYLKEHNE